MYSSSKVKSKKILASFVVLIIISCLAIVGYNFAMYKILYPVKYDSIIEQYANEYNLEKSLVYAVINSESSFKPNAVSSVGALGLMQITPETFDWLQNKKGETYESSELFNPEVAIEYGCYLLRLNLDLFEDDKVAIAAYHAGRTCVTEWLQNSEYSSDGKTLNLIPYKDTSKYVQSVINAQEKYKELYKV